MFVLFVDMKLKPGVEPDLEKTYTENFRRTLGRGEKKKPTDRWLP